MKHNFRPYHQVGLLTLAILGGTSTFLTAAQPDGTKSSSNAVLVELFTSEGCSSCPPADALLKQVSGRQTSSGQLIVGLSEHVSYWNGLGWKDPFSSDLYTARQNEYSGHFGLDTVYTPQMVVNGREQFVGGDRHALEAAFAIEAKRKQIDLHITSIRTTDAGVTFSYSASGLPDGGSFQLLAVLADDLDSSKVLRGENSGRVLQHVAVARALAALGPLHEADNKPITLPLPSSFAEGHDTGHHLVLFAQQSGTGAIIGVDSKPI